LPPAALAVVVVIAAVVAACGGTQSSSGASSSAAAADTGTNSTTAAHATTAGHTSTLTPRQKAVKFTECMRADGVSDFPDPNASGQFRSYGVSVTPAVWTNAVAACKSLQPPGTLSAKLTPAQESAALEARPLRPCERRTGLPGPRQRAAAHRHHPDSVRQQARWHEHPQRCDAQMRPLHRRANGRPLMAPRRWAVAACVTVVVALVAITAGCGGKRSSEDKAAQVGD
jgi:hypothetical protein